MVNFKEKYQFSRFRRRYKFSRGGGGLSDFFQGGGGPLLIPYRNPYNLVIFQGVSRPPVPTLDPHLAAILSSI